MPSVSGERPRGLLDVCTSKVTIKPPSTTILGPGSSLREGLLSPFPGTPDQTKVTPQVRLVNAFFSNPLSNDLFFSGECRCFTEDSIKRDVSLVQPAPQPEYLLKTWHAHLTARMKRKERKQKWRNKLVGTSKAVTRRAFLTSFLPKEWRNEAAEIQVNGEK